LSHVFFFPVIFAIAIQWDSIAIGNSKVSVLCD